MMSVSHDFARDGWLHFFPMDRFGSVSFLPVKLQRADGCRVLCDDGNWVFDAISGAYCVNVGYGRSRILDAARRAGGEIHYVAPFAAAHDGLIALSDRLAELAIDAMGERARVFFVNSGSEAVDTAIKLARAYQKRVLGIEGSKKNRVFSRAGAYHGTTFGALSVSGYAELHEEFGPIIGGVGQIASAACHQCSFGLVPDSCTFQCCPSPAELEQAAAIIVEPIETSAGSGLTKQGGLALLRQAATSAGALVIADEVISGFGRTGAMFASTSADLDPDVIVCAKGLTSGYEALAAVLVRASVADAFLTDRDHFRHGSTFAARPAACAAALENLAILDEEQLAEHVRVTGPWLGSILTDGFLGIPSLGMVRGTGFLWSVDLLGPARGSDSAVEGLRREIFREGVLVSLYMTKSDRFIDIAPPLICGKEELVSMTERIARAVRRWEATL